MRFVYHQHVDDDCSIIFIPLVGGYSLASNCNKEY